MTASTPSRRVSAEGSLRAVAAYERLRDAIVHGEYRPKEPLIEAEIAERFGIGRTPIRECMQRLAAEGLVVRRRRGWAVHEHSREEIRELYELRAGLEGFAARLAAERASDEAIATLAEIHRADDADLVRSPRERLVEVNDAFHEALVGAAGNEQLAQSVRRSHEHFFNYRVLHLFTDEEAAAAIAGHQRIVDALMSRDADLADREARDHVLSAVNVVLAKVFAGS